MITYNTILLFSGVHNQQLLMRLHLSIIQLLVECIPALKTSQSLVQVKTSPGASSPQTHADNTQPKQGEGSTGDTARQRENSGGEGTSPQTEEEENQDKIQELLVVFEKKLQSSLMALIKIQSSAKSSKKW